MHCKLELLHLLKENLFNCMNYEYFLNIIQKEEI